MAANRLNWTVLDNAALAFAKRLGLTESRKGFPALIISSLLNITAEEANDSETDGASDRGIDALYYDERDDQNALHLFNFKYHSDFSDAENSFPGNEVDKVSSFINDLTNRNADALRKTCNPALRDKIEYLWDKIVYPNFEIRIHFCSNGGYFNPIARRHADDQFLPSFIQFEELATDDIVDQLIRSKDQRVDGQIQLIEKQFFPRIDGSVRGLIATAHAPDLIELLRDPISLKQINRSAFNENIRLYLGNKNEVNRSIFETALGDQNSEFWYLNNGITIVCEKFTYNDVRSPIVELTNFQVVNGGQTANALFEAFQHDEDRVQNVYLLMRIYEASGADIKLKIAAATNNQTRINSRDLKSNDPVQRRLEEGLAPLGYFYERKKDQHTDQSPNKRIDALRAGQTFLAYYEREPDKAKTQSNRIFGEWYSKIFNADTTPQKLLCPVLLASEIEARKVGVRQSVRTGLTRDVENEFLLEGAFHVLFVIGLLCTRSEARLDDYAKARLFVDEAVRITGDIAKQYQGKSFYKFFRSVESKDILFNKVFAISPLI